MEPKRLRFSDLSSGSESRSFSSRSPLASGSDDFVLRLSTSFTSISTPSTHENRESHENDQFFRPAPPPADSNPSRHSCATTASGTTVWTVHGSSRNTMGVGMPVSGSRSNESAENTERIDQDTLKLRRRTVATVSSNNSEERATTPTIDLLSSISPTVPIQRKVVISIADDTDELPPTQPTGPLKDVVAFVEVFSGADDRSGLIGNALRDLGATVCQRLTAKVTHVIFREGRQSTLERARSKNVHLVSVLWVEACERENIRLPESTFAIGRRARATPSVVKDRRFRSMQPRPHEAELALTDDRIRKRKLRLEASKQKREVRKDIREGRLAAATSTIEKSASSNFETPATVIPLKVRSHTDTGRWMSGEEDETPESLRRQVANVRMKILGATDTPNSRRESAIVPEHENLAGSIRKKLFEDEDGKLHGTPVPPFLDRPKRITRSATMGCQSTSSIQRPKSPISLRHMSSVNGGPLAEDAQADAQRPHESKIDEIVNSVCEKVTNLAIEVNKVPQSTRRRIFDRTSERISDGMLATPESSGQAAPGKSLTSRVAATHALVDVDDIFGTASSVAKEIKGKTASRKGKGKSEMIRLRSSLFHVKSASDIVKQLQAARRSSEDFRSPKQGKGGVRNRAPTKTATQYPNSVKRRSKSRRSEATRSLVLTNVSQDDRELIYVIVKRMKGFRVENKVTADTTHIICGENKRTLNVLMGVARGCWMLPVEWVYHSLANGTWIPEEQFEMFDQFPAARDIRRRKKTVVGDLDFSPTCHIFTGLGAFYVMPSTQPPANDLCTLIRWCDGKVALTSKRASYCVGGPPTHEDAVGVKETWILDSVMQHRLLSIEPYLIK